MRPGERQVAPVLSGIRRDHRARYEFAARTLPAGGRVIDLACGVGYGAFILAEAGHQVVGIDVDAAAIAYARTHYSHPRAAYRCAPAEDVYGYEAGSFDAAVCFETIEHIADPLPMLKALRAAAPVLLASVPNEAVFPWRGYAFHHRHYTRAELAELLREAGWRAGRWWGQEGPESEVEPDMNGRTIMTIAERGPIAAGATMSATSAEERRGPGHVVILGLGPSLESYVDLVKRLGGRKAFADEVWAINALGDVVQCDMVFHMDDVRIQEIRAAAMPESNIARMLDWLKTHPGPVMTSRAHPDYPGLVEFPLEDVINELGYCYLNNTAAYAMAYALYRGAEKVSFFGCDYTYANVSDAEKGRACLEFWLGIAAGRGVKLGISDKSSLMDSCEPDDLKLYGYDTLKVTVRTQNGEARVSFEPRDTLPTAAEIEARYDHSKHPSPLVKS